jgi:acetyl-CoA acetyltransferase
VSEQGVIIAGAAETDEIGKLPGVSTLGLHVAAARNAVADAGLTMKDIDGIATVSAPGPVQVAHALGIYPDWLDGTGIGGTSFLLHVRHAVAAIRAGYAKTILITHGESGRSRVGAPPYRMDLSSPPGQFEVPYGTLGPTTMFTIPMLRYMKDYGLTHEQLAYVAVAQRQWAAKNPRAMFRDIITVEDVLASRMVAYPFHLLECCLVTDGGGALIVTSADRAAGFPKPPVHVLGTGESSETPMISQMIDFTESRMFRQAGRKAFAEAGITVADVDHLMIYDAFAHVPIYGLEALGFVGKGEAGPFISGGNTEPGGTLPLNTNGGGLSYTHTGMYGMFAIQEGVRQIRGEAAAQVDHPAISVILGNGGMFASCGVLVLGRQPRS